MDVDCFMTMMLFSRFSLVVDVVFMHRIQNMEFGVKESISEGPGLRIGYVSVSKDKLQ